MDLNDSQKINLQSITNKKKLIKLNNSLNFGEKSISQIWKDYLNQVLLVQINHSNDLAVIQLNQLKIIKQCKLIDECQMIVSKDGKTFSYLKNCNE
ncbi:unnamed protein product [Paramecium pentaurelia]|uniref:Uncharacterized protein n=1 Tax=Paramecium pentaurelia TaxID=43138 RepID=A0A8S1X1Z0_9CILI|nr:unnamed protein product [Paramecium pentaurelia]